MNQATTPPAAPIVKIGQYNAMVAALQTLANATLTGLNATQAAALNTIARDALKA